MRLCFSKRLREYGKLLESISPGVTKDRMNAYLKDFSLKSGMSWTIDIVDKQWRGQSFEYVDEGLQNAFEKD